MQRLSYVSGVPVATLEAYCKYSMVYSPEPRTEESDVKATIPHIHKAMTMRQANI